MWNVECSQSYLDHVHVLSLSRGKYDSRLNNIRTINIIEDLKFLLDEDYNSQHQLQ